MIQTATKYALARSVQTCGPRPAPAAPRVFVPTLTGARTRLQDWYWRELKEGGYLSEYLRAEKGRTPEMIRRVGRMMHGFTQNPKSDLRRLAAVPARLYHRWKQEDKEFFSDNNNLRSLKRDNPDLPVYVEPRQMPRSAFHKVYPATA